MVEENAENKGIIGGQDIIIEIDESTLRSGNIAEDIKLKEFGFSGESKKDLKICFLIKIERLKL